MMEPRTHRRVSRKPKKRVPLSKLRTSEVVKTVVDHPRRLEELVNMLEDKERVVRDRAATILARVSETHPGRLLRILERIRDAFADDSAYVRWHVAYTLGRIGSSFPTRAPRFLAELSTRLDDDNRLVRVFACRALARVAIRKPQVVKQLFDNSKREVPTALARVLQHPGLQSGKSQNR